MTPIRCQGLGNTEIDGKIIGELEKLPEEAAVSCLDSLGKSDLQKIQNKSGVNAIVSPMRYSRCWC